MMYPRLKLARNLLSDRGLMMISIDENEVANLVRLCEEVFGRSNVVGALPVVMNMKGNQDAFGFSETHEFVVVCCREKSTAIVNEFPVDEEGLLAEWEEDEYGLFKEADNLRATGVNAPRAKRPNLWYPIFIDVAASRVYATVDDHPESAEHLTVWPVSPEGDELSWYWSKAKLAAESHNLILKYTKNGHQFYKKQRAGLDELPTKKPKSFLFKPSYSTSTATKKMKELMGGKYFSAPKPVPFLSDLILLGTTKESVVLDFFAGSGSTVEAIFSLNATDGGNRRVIAVQLAEEFPDDTEARQAGFKTIPDLARTRIVKAAHRVLSGSVAPEWRRDVGFRLLRIDTTNLADTRRTPDESDQAQLDLEVESVKSDRTGEDLLFQVLLDWGLDLTLPIIVEPIDGHQVFVIDDGALIACFDKQVHLDVVRQIAKREPLRAVFLDAGFATDDARINAEQIFREVSPSTDVKTI